MQFCGAFLLKKAMHSCLLVNVLCLDYLKRIELKKNLQQRFFIGGTF